SRTVRVQHSLAGDGGVQNLLEISSCVVVAASFQLDIPRGEPGDRLGLAREIPPRRIRDGVAESARPIEVQDDAAQPRLTEDEEPRVITVFLGHLPARAENAQQLAELPRLEQRHRLAAQREEVRHQARGLIRLRDAGFQTREGLSIVALEHEQVCVDHLVIVRQSGWTELLQGSASGLAHLPMLVAPRVIEELAASGQQLGAAAEQWIAEARAERQGFLDGSNAAVRVDEAERTDEKAQCCHPSGCESG